MNERKNTKKGSYLRLLAAGVIAIICYVLGLIVGFGIDEKTKTSLGISALVCIGIVVVLLVFNVLAARVYGKKREMSVREMQRYYLDRREEARTDLGGVVSRMIFIRRAINVYALSVLLLSLFITFCMGMGKASGVIVLGLYLIYGFLTRISPSMEKTSYEGYTEPEQYPELHRLAHDAARVLGMDGEIRIALTSDCSAGIAKTGKKTYSLVLGVALLDIMSEEELYQILLHEFAHMTKDGNPNDKEYRLFHNITEKESDTMTAVAELLFKFFDTVYVFEYVTYRMVVSVANEYIADAATRKLGDAQTAANALAKTAYSTLFDREKARHIKEHYYEREQMRDNVADVVCSAFREAIKVRSEFWDGILAAEIQPRSSTHPIFRERIKALGVSSYSVVMPEETGKYRSECKKARESINKLIYDAEAESYPQEREENYLKPLRIVEKWKENGCRIEAEESREVINSLCALGCFDQAEELCDRIIEETSNKYATAHSHMTKGMIMLNRYDKGGIEHLYEAIEINHNYAEQCSEAIGEFCCIMGLEEELEEYRERALDYGQREIDQYSKANQLTSADKLVPDDMPKDMLEDILGYIKAADKGKDVLRVYLVKKIITEEYSPSVFVLQFKAEAEEERAFEVMDKVFNHLDTRPENWEFSLFYYDAQTAPAVAKVKESCVYDAASSN